MKTSLKWPAVEILRSALGQMEMVTAVTESKGVMEGSRFLEFFII